MELIATVDITLTPPADPKLIAVPRATCLCGSGKLAAIQAMDGGTAA
jgi:hypothetical protein